jgi:hypothetical protein
MKLWQLSRHTLAVLAALAPAAALAQAVIGTPYAAISGSTVTFEDLVLPDPEGSLLDGIVSSGGVAFGERFDGQELARALAPRPGSVAQDWFDDLSFGSPTAGLVLLAGASGANLGGYDYGGANAQALAGIGPQNTDGSDPFGFGAISGRFAVGVSALGLQIRESDGGAGWLNLYRADGSLIQTLSLGPLVDGYYGYARSDGSADIAGFSLYHRDTYYGIAIDNLVYGSAAPVPEPGAATLMVAGLLLGIAVFKRAGRSGRGID